MKQVGESALDTLQASIKSIGELFTSSFIALPSELQRNYIEGYSNDLSNPGLKKLKHEVEDQTFKTLDLMRNVQMWVQLQIPKIEDGNNFGVSVQMQLVRNMSETSDKLTNIFDEIATFHEKRSVLVDALSPKTKQEVKTNEVLEAVEKDKAGTTKSSMETTTTSVPLEEQLEALASIDVKLYLRMKEAIRSQRNYLLTTQDFVAKNEKRIKNPRGTNYSNSYAL